MQILYFLSAALTQVSIVLLFHRIFGHHRRFRLALASTAFVIVSFWGSYTISAFLGCRPLGSMSESCVDFLPFMRISAALSFILNLIIFVLPIPVVWSLEITTRQKFEALTVTSAGLLYVFHELFWYVVVLIQAERVSIASIMRVVSFMNADTVDLTFSGVAPMSWCSIEQGALIVCASLPVLRPLLRCCRSRSSQDSQESITSFGLQPVHESMAGDIESLNVHAKSTTSTATSSRRDTIVQDNGKGWPKPAQVGVALSPVEQDATVIFHDHPICAAILASGSSNDIFCNNMMADQRGPSLTPEIAAFRQQTRGLGHSKSNFF